MRKKRNKINWNDPLGIDEMSDEEFLEKLPELRKKSVYNGVGSLILGILFFVLIVVLWDVIF